MTSTTLALYDLLSLSLLSQVSRSVFSSKTSFADGIMYSRGCACVCVAAPGWWLVLSGRNFGFKGGDFRVWVSGLELQGVTVVREHTRLQVRTVGLACCRGFLGRRPCLVP